MRCAQNLSAASVTNLVLQPVCYTRSSIRAVSATRARSFTVTTRIPCSSIVRTPNRYRSIAHRSLLDPPHHRNCRSGSTTAVSSSVAASTRCTPSRSCGAEYASTLAASTSPSSDTA